MRSRSSACISGRHSHQHPCTCVLPYALGNRFGISGGETANLWAYREEESRYRVMHPRRSHNLLCEFTQLLPTFALSRWGPHYDSGSRGAAFGSGSIWRRGQRSGRSRQGNCQGDDAKPHTLNHKRLVKRRKLDSMALMTAPGSVAECPLLSEWWVKPPCRFWGQKLNGRKRSWRKKAALQEATPKRSIALGSRYTSLFSRI